MKYYEISVDPKVKSTAKNLNLLKIFNICQKNLHQLEGFSSTEQIEFQTTDL
jgi:hypothetical protein